MRYNVLCFFILMSCGSLKENKSTSFFNEWHNETNRLFKTNVSNKIQDNISEILEIELCNNKAFSNKKSFPKLEYRILQEYIKVNMYKYLTRENYALYEEIIFKDSLLNYNLNCKENNLKTLVLTNKYKKKIGKLSYGFGSEFSGENKANAKVIIEKHHSVDYYDLPLKIPYIEFNEAIDSSVINISKTYKSMGKRYIKLNGKWKFDKELYNLTE